MKHMGNITSLISDFPPSLPNYMELFQILASFVLGKQRNIDSLYHCMSIFYEFILMRKNSFQTKKCCVTDVSGTKSNDRFVFI